MTGKRKKKSEIKILPFISSHCFYCSVINFIIFLLYNSILFFFFFLLYSSLEVQHGSYWAKIPVLPGLCSYSEVSANNSSSPCSSSFQKLSAFPGSAPFPHLQRQQCCFFLIILPSSHLPLTVYHQENISTLSRPMGFNWATCVTQVKLPFSWSLA